MECYFDAAATSRPKSEAVVAAVAAALRLGASPGRSAYGPALEASRLIADARDDLASCLGVADSTRVAFTSNCTEAINLVLHGLLAGGGRVVVSAVEHNAVMRPLDHLARSAGVEVVRVAADAAGRCDPAGFAAAVAPGTALVVCTHASNVTGAIQPVAEIGAIAHRAGARMLVDAAQTAGCLPIAFDDLPADYLAFSGHKGLGGPQGVGGLLLAEGAPLPPLIRGGTGSRSQEEEQPEFLPDRLEAGTPNTPGIAGLGAAVRLLRAGDPAVARAKVVALLALLLDGLRRLPGVRVHGPDDPAGNIGNVAITVPGQDVAVLADRLWRDHGVMLRAGLQCAPAAHRAIGTWPTGTLRASLGPATTVDEVRHLLAALAAVLRG
jgi:cysteine desulfurase family protein